MFTAGQKRSLLVGFGIILAAASFIALIWMGMFLPGFAGEVFRKIAGLMWTPVILDVSLFLLGIILILWLNIAIRAREGEEYVSIELAENLPAASPTLSSRRQADPRDLEPGLCAIEGALKVDDLSEATTLLYELPADRLEEPGVRALRIELSRRKAHDKKAAALLEQLRVKSPHHPLSLHPPQESPGP